MATKRARLRRYGRLERNLRENWASLHNADASLKETRSSACTEVDSMKAMKDAQEREARGSNF